jgi:hypothetical protein
MALFKSTGVNSRNFVPVARYRIRVTSHYSIKGLPVYNFCEMGLGPSHRLGEEISAVLLLRFQSASFLSTSCSVLIRTF